MERFYHTEKNDIKLWSRKKKDVQNKRFEKVFEYFTDSFEMYRSGKTKN